MKCDEVEQAAVANGSIKKAKHRKKNAAELLKVRTNLVNGGVDALNAEKYDDAVKFLGMGNNPMVGATVAIAVAIQQSFAK